MCIYIYIYIYICIYTHAPRKAGCDRLRSGRTLQALGAELEPDEETRKIISSQHSHLDYNIHY